MKNADSRRSIDERAFMERTIAEMTKSEGKGPRVGAVIVMDGNIVSVGHRKIGTHAERAAIEDAQAHNVKLKGATIYTTLEPCVSIGRGHKSKESCASLISSVGISEVVIGRYDPNPHVNRIGWKALRDSGVTLRDFDADLRDRIDDLNAQFAGHFETGTGPTGGAKFDYMLNDGDFEIVYSAADDRRITTRWTMAGKRAIYAYARQPLKVALAKFAQRFAEIDDPTALDFRGSVRVEEGEIVAFVDTTGCALVQVLEVHSGPRYGSDHTSVRLQYEVRILLPRDL
jgi:diaminohydroxyphosphoribosylaminopyrimidine deaminase / 5-amino-6-(5-phosphoribosylamino)uracil reductase